MAGAPNLDGLAYVFTVPFGLFVGFACALVMSLFMGPTWWLLAPIFSGLVMGINLGYWMEGK